VNRVAVLGSTGSVGTQTLDVIRCLGSQVRVVALAAGRNTELLSQQVAEFLPALFFCEYPDRVPAGGARFASLDNIATDESVDTVVAATAGSAGLGAVLAALKAGKRVALANKEALVMAGALMTKAAASGGGRLVPVDSEHSALWQCMQGESGDTVSRLLLTASGGPVYSFSESELSSIAPEEALAHPVWSMGRKITVDSATLMNKGLEVIEAHWLFDVPFARIDVLVHPECVVHSMVEFTDGSTKAQLGEPNMLLPIQYALTWPTRVPGPVAALRWDCNRSLTFEPVDDARFPLLRLARGAGEAGGTVPAALCGADEAAVELFLEGAIGFHDIARLVETAVNAHSGSPADSLQTVLAAEAWGRRYVKQHAFAARMPAGRPITHGDSTDA